MKDEEIQRLLIKYFRLYGYKLPEEVVELVACDFYENNIRKISEDSVVLSADEFANLKKYAYKKGSKETAEKILKAIITKLIDNIAIEGDWQLEDFEYSGEEIKEVLNELAKQFGVEIKED